MAHSAKRSGQRRELLTADKRRQQSAWRIAQSVSCEEQREEAMRNFQEIRELSL